MKAFTSSHLALSQHQQHVLHVPCHTTAASALAAAAGHDNGQILLWRMDTGSHTVLGPQAHTNSISCMTPVTSVKGDEQLVSAGFDGWVCLWEPRQVRGIKPHLIAR
jgi:WD40 repeat protein